MELILAGVSHRTASVAARGPIAARLGHGAAGLAHARDEMAVSELLVLATCHRVELYAIAPDADESARRLHAFLASACGAETAPAPDIYMRTGLEALTHLCHVACGLDSMIVGEAEIAGQVRRAAADARAARTMGPCLEAVIAGALAASGRARSETGIATGVLSAASASVALATAAFGSLADRAVLVVGAGQTGRQVLARIARAPHGPVVVASRSEKHAREAAAGAGAAIAGLEALPALVAAADLVIAAVQAPNILIDDALCARAMRGRGDRRLFVIDLSMPRVVADAAGSVPGVDVRTVDDLGDIARASAARRAAEIPRVRAIAGDEAARAYRRVAGRRRRLASR